MLVGKVFNSLKNSPKEVVKALNETDKLVARLMLLKSIRRSYVR